MRHIDGLITMENHRHDAILAQLSLLREQALEGPPPRKKRRVATKNETHSDGFESSEEFRHSQLAILDELRMRVGVSEKLPGLKAIAGRVAVRLLARIINDMKSKGKAINLDNTAGRSTDVVQSGVWKDIVAAVGFNHIMKA